MAEFHVLETLTQQDQEDVIDTLESALEQARAGRISAIAIAVVRPGGFLNGTWSQTDAGPALIGSLAVLQSKLIKCLDEGS